MLKGGVCGKGVLLRIKSNCCAGFFLVVDIDTGSWVISHDDHSQPRCNPLLFLQSRSLLGDSFFYAGGNRLAVDYRCHCSHHPFRRFFPALHYVQRMGRSAFWPLPSITLRFFFVLRVGVFGLCICVAGCFLNAVSVFLVLGFLFTKKLFAFGGRFLALRPLRFQRCFLF